MDDLRIRYPLSDLFRKGSPLWMPRGLSGEPRPGVLTGDGRYAGDDGSLMALNTGLDAPWLDDADPTGRFHMLLYLASRGQDLRWAEGEHEGLAWSVLSVSRGGPPLQDILHPWKEAQDGGWVRGRAYDPKNKGGGLWVCEVLETETAFGWESSLTIDPNTGWWQQGAETGTAGRATADQAALAAFHALREPDGTLRLPPLPPLPEHPHADPG